MPRLTRIMGRRAGPIGLALTAIDLWTRLPERQRRLIAAKGKEHGTRIAAEALRRGAAMRGRQR